jgi:hypothetical protein
MNWNTPARRAFLAIRIEQCRKSARVMHRLGRGRDAGKHIAMAKRFARLLHKMTTAANP